MNSQQLMKTLGQAFAIACTIVLCHWVIPAQSQPLTVSESSPIVIAQAVPGGGLTAHEAVGGHTLERHVSKTPQQLMQRLANEPQINAASSFPDARTAEQLVGEALVQNRKAIATWLNNQERRYSFNSNCLIQSNIRFHAHQGSGSWKAR